MGETNWDKWKELGVFAPATQPSDLMSRKRTVQPGIGPKKVSAVPKVLQSRNNVDNIKIYAPILEQQYNIATNVTFLDDHPDLKTWLLERGFEVKDWKLDIVLVDYKVALELHGGVSDKQTRGAHVRETGYINDRLKMMAAQLCGYYTLEFPTQRIGAWLELLPLFVQLRESEVV